MCYGLVFNVYIKLLTEAFKDCSVFAVHARILTLA